MAEPLLYAVLALIVGTLGAIVYCLRILVLMERRVANIETHIDKVVHRILRAEEEELRILRRPRTPAKRVKQVKKRKKRRR